MDFKHEWHHSSLNLYKDNFKDVTSKFETEKILTLKVREQGRQTGSAADLHSATVHLRGSALRLRGPREVAGLRLGSVERVCRL